MQIIKLDSQQLLVCQKTEIFFLDFCERDDGNGKRTASWEKEHGKSIPGIPTKINNLPCEGEKGITLLMCPLDVLCML